MKHVVSLSVAWLGGMVFMVSLLAVMAELEALNAFKQANRVRMAAGRVP